MSRVIRFPVRGVDATDLTAVVLTLSAPNPESFKMDGVIFGFVPVDGVEGVLLDRHVLKLGLLESSLKMKSWEGSVAMVFSADNLKFELVDELLLLDTSNVSC